MNNNSTSKIVSKEMFNSESYIKEEYYPETDEIYRKEYIDISRDSKILDSIRKSIDKTRLKAFKFNN